nr:MAG TPA: hypothetical protein [Caudoviricetes sp.]
MLFLRFAQFYHLKYKADKSGYNTASATPDAGQVNTSALL